MATVLRSNSAEGGTDGVAVTTGNSGGTSGDAWDLVAVDTGASVAFDAADHSHGGMSYKITPAASAAGSVRWTGLSLTALYFSIFWKRQTVADSGGITTILRAKASGNACFVQINQSGQIRLANAAQAQLWTSAALTDDTWYRIEGHVAPGSGTTDGTIEVRYYDSAGNLIDSYSASNVNASTGSIGEIHIGDVTPNAAFTNLTPMHVDSIQVASDGWIGDWPTTLPDPADTVQPISVTSNAGGYTAVNAADIVAALANPADTTAYIEATSGEIVVREAPLTAAPRKIPVVARTDVAPATIKIEALQGSTVRATLSATALTTSWATYTLVLTDPERASVTTEGDGSVDDLDIRATTATS